MLSSSEISINRLSSTTFSKNPKTSSSSYPQTCVNMSALNLFPIVEALSRSRCHF